MNTRRPEALRIWKQIVNLPKDPDKVNFEDKDKIVGSAISLTSNPMLYTRYPDSPEFDINYRFSLAKSLIAHIGTKKPEAESVNIPRNVVISFKDTAQKSDASEEADEKTLEFRKNVRTAGYVSMKKEDQEYLDHRGLLPEKMQGTEVTSALHLYANGARSEEIAQKAEVSSSLMPGERDYLLRTAYFVACFEEANLKADLPSPDLVQAANLNPEVTEIRAYTYNVSPDEYQFTFASNGNSLVPLIPFDDNPDSSTQSLQGQLGDMLFNAINKGGQKLVKKAGKEIAGKVGKKVGLKIGEEVGEKVLSIAAKAGVKALTKAGLETAAQAANVVPGAGIIIAVVIEIADRVWSLVKRGLVKLKRWFEEHPAEAAFYSLALLGGGLIFGSLPLALLGIGGLLLTGAPAIGAVGSVVATTIAVIAAIVVAIAYSIALAVAYILGFSFIIGLILFMINAGGYVVPYWDANVDPLSQGNNVSNENPYIGVGKVANPTKAPNPTTINYTITIIAKQGNLTNVKISTYDCKYFKKGWNSPADCSNLQPPSLDPDLVVQVNVPYTFHYSIPYSGAFQDALVVDTVTITADTPSQSGVSASSTASVCFGDCPSDCVKVVPGGWPNGNLETAVGILSAQYQPFMQKVCASSWGDVNLCYKPTLLPDGGNCNHVIYARHEHTSSCDVIWNKCGISSVGDATYMLAHELTHHIQKINGSYFQAYLGSGSTQELPFCTYSNTNPLVSSDWQYEGMAESVGLYVGKPSWDGCAANYASKYPKNYSFAQNTMFH